MVSLGSNAHSNREHMHQKHSMVLDSLVPLYATDIKGLDLPYTKDGFTYTLRELILGVRHPLGSDSRLAPPSSRLTLIGARLRRLFFGSCPRM